MPHRVVVILCLPLLLAFSTTAAAQSWRGEDDEPEHAPFELMLGAGVNMCIDSGDRDCDDIGMHVLGFLSPGVRLSNLVSVALDVSVGMLTPTEADEGYIVTTTIMPTLRLFHVFDDGEFYGGIGAGYSRLDVDWSASGTESSPGYYNSWLTTSNFHWSGFTNVKLTTGVHWEFVEGRFAGFNLDLIYNTDESGEICDDDGCTDRDAANLDYFQPTFVLKWQF